MDMKLTDFLEHHVEGYLLEDLRAMAPIQAPSARGGGLGYPMVSSAIAGMELLGFLLCKDPNPKGGGHRYFSHYWSQYFCPGPDSKYAAPDLPGALYEAVRNPLAHSFMTAPNIEIVKGDSSDHLTVNLQTKAVRVDCVALYRDFEVSYRTNVRQAIVDKPDPGLAERMRANMGKLLDHYSENKARPLKTVLEQHPDWPSGTPSSSIQHNTSRSR